MNRCDRVSREWQRFCKVGSRLRSENESEDIFPFHLVMKWTWGEHLSNLWLGIVQSTSLDDALPSHQNYKVSGAALRSAICTVQVYSHCTLVQLVSSTNWREAVTLQLERTQHIWIMRTAGTCSVEKRWDSWENTIVNGKYRPNVTPYPPPSPIGVVLTATSCEKWLIKSPNLVLGLFHERPSARSVLWVFYLIFDDSVL